MNSSQIMLLQPRGWNDKFVISFIMVNQPVTNLQSTVPPQYAYFPEGGQLFDPENISIAAANSGKTPFEALMSNAMTGWQNYTIENVHGTFPTYNSRQTAVGGGWTWVALPPVSPFKILYTCFQERQPSKEALHGVPSGGGWHKIGDPAESISTV